MKLKQLTLLAGLAGFALAGKSYAYDCTGLTDFSGPIVPTIAISTDMKIIYKDQAYQCKESGWCNQWGAYAPGESWAWVWAWHDLGACTNSSSSSSSSSTSSSSSGWGAITTRLNFASFEEPDTLNIKTGESAAAKFAVTLAGNYSFDRFEVKFYPPNGKIIDCGQQFVPDWEANTIYTGSDLVVYKGMAFKAKWWTQDSPVPFNPWEAWRLEAACKSAGISGPGFSWDYDSEPGRKRYSKEYYFPVDGTFTLEGCALDSAGNEIKCATKTITASSSANTSALGFSSPINGSPVSAPINVDVDITSGQIAVTSVYFKNNNTKKTYFQSELSPPFVMDIFEVLKTYNSDSEPLPQGTHGLISVGVDSSNTVIQRTIEVNVQ